MTELREWIGNQEVVSHLHDDHAKRVAEAKRALFDEENEGAAVRVAADSQPREDAVIPPSGHIGNGLGRDVPKPRRPVPSLPLFGGWTARG